MDKAEQKTKPTEQPVSEFLAEIEPDRREDAQKLSALMAA